MIKKQLGLLAVAMILSACAGMDAVPIKPDQPKSNGKETSANSSGDSGDAIADSDAKGFRYYQTAPFLFVHTDGKGGIAGEVVWLPDTTKKMSIRPYSWMATNDVTLKFQNGMLTEASSAVDETVVPNAILTALAAAVSKVPFALENAPKGKAGEVPVPYLFKISVEGDQVVLRGGYPHDTNGEPLEIKATIVNQGD